MNIKIDIDVKYTKAILPWSPIFDIYFQILIMLQRFLIGRLLVAMGTVSKIRLRGFVRNVLIQHLPMYG